MNYLIHLATTEAAVTSAMKTTTLKKHIESPSKYLQRNR